MANIDPEGAKSATISGGPVEATPTACTNRGGSAAVDCSAAAPVKWLTVTDRIALSALRATARFGHLGICRRTAAVDHNELSLSDQIARVLHFKRLHAVMQPVFRVSDGALYGFEGLIRGPAGSPLAMPRELFAVAAAAGRRAELELAAARTVCRQFAALELGGRLLLNLSCSAVEAIAREPDGALKALERDDLDPARIIIELTEHESVRDASRFADSLRTLRDAGIGLALDDFGSGHSNLQLWMELRPKLVKLDRVFVHGLAGNGDRFEIVRFMKGLADSFGTLLCAEGVEHASDLAVVRDIGIDLAQGFLLGVPLARPARTLSDEAAEVLLKSRLGDRRVAPSTQQPLRLAGELAIHTPPVADTLTNNALAEFLHQNPTYQAVAVVRADAPVGIINRRGFMDRLAQPYYREIYGRRPVTGFMNPEPVMVDWRAPLSSMTRVLAGSDQRYLADGFIITDNGRYKALGTGESLVRAVSELRIEAARYANPLTFLPGGIPIAEQIDCLLSRHMSFAACYADLNDFKPFNDQFGYWRGDEVIRLAARVIQNHIDPSSDFVGHVGGDDFIVLLQSPDWRARCERMIREFNLAVQAFFHGDERATGTFLGEDRRGQACRFPLTTLSIGAIEVQAGDPGDHETVSHLAAHAKRHAKSAGARLYVLPREPRPSLAVLTARDFPATGVDLTLRLPSTSAWPRPA